MGDVKRFPTPIVAVGEVKVIEECTITIHNKTTNENVVMVCSLRDDGNMEVDTNVDDADKEPADKSKFLHLMLMQGLLKSMNTSITEDSIIMRQLRILTTSKDSRMTHQDFATFHKDIVNLVKNMDNGR